MNKEKAIKFVLEALGISSFENLSTSYNYIKQNNVVILNRQFTDQSRYFKIKSLIENIWEIERIEKEINYSLMN